MWATTLYNYSNPPLQWAAVLGGSLAAAVLDVRSRRIPNLLTGPMLLIGLGCACWLGGLAGLMDSAVACLMLATPYVLLFIFAGGGAGDAKIMGALGAWLGVVYGAWVLLSVALCGVVLALAWALARGRLKAVLVTISGAVKGLIFPLFGGGSFRDLSNSMPAVEDGQKLPYGLAILAGVLLTGGGFLYWRMP